MQTDTFLGALIGPLGFGLVVAHASFRWGWSLAAGAVFAAAVLLFAGVRQLGRRGSASTPHEMGQR
jgi:hypothetical protein